LCQSGPGVKLIRGLSSTSKAEDLWTTRLGTAYSQPIPFSLIVVALCAMQNSSHLIATVIYRLAKRIRREVAVGVKVVLRGRSHGFDRQVGHGIDSGDQSGVAA
jgi:hypothetical protein